MLTYKTNSATKKEANLLYSRNINPSNQNENIRSTKFQIFSKSRRFLSKIELTKSKQK